MKTALQYFTLASVPIAIMAGFSYTSAGDHPPPPQPPPQPPVPPRPHPPEEPPVPPGPPVPPPSPQIKSWELR